MVLVNAHIITMDSANPSAEWVVVSDRTIRAVGSGRDYERYILKNTEVIDCRGRTILPGFIDAHLHLRAFAESCVSLDLTSSLGFKSIAEIKTAIRDLCQETAQGGWIRGRGYNEFYLLEKRHPTRWDLDEVAPAHPVKLTHRSGHAHVLNSLALRLLGISKETADPAGGMIDRDTSTGEPTGLLYEMGEILSGSIPPLNEQELLTGIRLANQALLSQGVTSVQDASHTNDCRRWKQICSWKKDGILRPRINFMLGPKGFEELRNASFPSPVAENRLRLNGIKVMLDETTGELRPSQAELNKLVLTIHRTGLQVAIHAIEENAVQSALSAINPNVA